MSLVLAQPNSVAVVGAGIAGLTAARRLAAAGADVVVFEARDRVGGRAYSTSAGFVDGQHADLGGELLFDAYRSMTELCEALGVPLSEPVSVERPGTTEETSLEGLLEEGRILADGALLKGAAFEAVEAELRGAIAGSPPAPHEPLDQWSRRVRLSSVARRVLGGIVRFTTQADLDQVDGHYAFGGRLGPMRRVVGGTQRFAEALADGLEIELETPVRAIRQGGGVEVRTETGETRRFERAILAVPFLVLPTLGIEPPLPATKLAALNAFQAAVGGKVVAQYAEGDAVRAALTRPCISGDAINSLWVGNPYVTDGPAVVAGFFCGVDRARLESPGEAVELLDRAVEAATGSPVTRLAVATKDWTSDRWALAITTTPAEEMRVDQVARAAVPVGRLHFAGDHTDVTLCGTMEGAVRSGMRAADEILRRPVRIPLSEIPSRLVRQ